MRTLLAAAALIVLAASPASAMPVGGAPATAATPSGSDHAQGYRKAQAIRALRKEGLALRVSDGGTLTAEHRAELQTRLDRILAGNY